MMLSIFAQSPAIERTVDEIELARWSTGNSLLIGGTLTAVALYAVFWMYRREARGRLTQRMRWSLIVCRAIILVVLGLIGLEPVLVRYVHRRLDAATLVLLDDSASMGLADHYRDPAQTGKLVRALGQEPLEPLKRSTLETRLVNQNSASLIRALAAQNPVKIFTFSDTLRLREQIPMQGGTASSQPDISQIQDLTANGSRTDVSLAVRGAVDSAQGAPVAGVVLFSDGGFNHGESPAAAAALLREKRIPLYVIGVGDPSPATNVRIAEVAAPRHVFKNDPFSIRVRIAAEGSIDQPLRVDLLARPDKAGADETVVDSRVVAWKTGSGFEDIVFERKVKSPGPVRFKARVEPAPYESVASDNERTAFPTLQVLDDKMRVLIIAGAPTYDYRYLARMLERDTTVDVSCWLQSADAQSVREGDNIIKELPTQPEELAHYDAVLLLDCDPTELEPTWGSSMAGFVTDHGGGLLYQAGNKFTTRFLRAPSARSLVELLPIVPEPDAEIILNDLGHYQTSPWTLRFTEAGLADPVLRLAENPAENSAVWSILEGVYWHYPVRRPKPAATVLFEHSNPRMTGAFGQHVLLATQFAGSGRTAFLGINSTWRWRRGDERYFNRFWLNVLRFLVEGRLAGEHSRIAIQTQKDLYEPGESVGVTVRALDERYNPLALPELELKMVTDDAAHQPRSYSLQPVPGRDGYYQSRLILDQIGVHRLEVTLPAGSASEKDTKNFATREIVVTQPDLEMRNTPMQRAALMQFAELAGGRFLEVDETPRLSELIPNRGRTSVTRERPRPLWDTPLLLGLLVSLLSVEWILRKRAKLL